MALGILVPAVGYGASQGFDDNLAEAKPLFIDEASSRQSAFGDIPFSAGKTRLGPKGRRAVRELAERMRGMQLRVAVCRDADAPLSQAKARGAALRAEFAKYGISDIAWLDGGEAPPGAGLRYAKASVLATTLVSAPTAANPAQASAAVGAPFAANTPEAGQANRLAAQLGSLKRQHERHLLHLQALAEQQLLNAEELRSAKALLAVQWEKQSKKLQDTLNALQAARGLAAAAVPVAQERHGKAKPVWMITEQDTSVRVLFEKWAKAMGCRLVWDVPLDIKINARADIAGSFEDAINTVLSSLRSTQQPLAAELYEANAVLRIAFKEAR